MINVLSLVIAFTGAIDATPQEVLNVAQSVLVSDEFNVASISSTELVTEHKNIDVAIVAGYISEPFPDDNPGWEKARVRIVLIVYGDERAEFEIRAFFERFGVPDAFLLIPQTWVSVPSNGVLESKLRQTIEHSLPGGRQ